MLLSIEICFDRFITIRDKLNKVLNIGLYLSLKKAFTLYCEKNGTFAFY